MNTTRQISENPAKHAVTSPTDPKVKQADIDRKMRVYGIINALNQGRYPSNAQIDKTLQYILSHSPIDKHKLSRDGRELIEDVQSVIETARQIVLVKNEDELFQNFLYSTRFVDNSKLNPANGVNAPVGKEDAQQDGQDAAENFKVLAKLIFTNSEFRKILKDLGLLARDVVADGAAKVAETARPNGDSLAQVDEPAPDNQWISKDGTPRGPHESVPDTGLAEKRQQAKQAKSDLSSKADQIKQQGASAAQNHADDVSGRLNQAHASAPGDAGQLPSNAEQTAVRNEASNIASEKGQLAKNKAGGLYNRIPEEHKDRAREYRDRAKDYAKEKFPEERRERFIYRLKKVIVEQQRHRDYQDAIEFFIGLAETYHGHAKHVGSQSAGHTTSLTDDPAFNAAYLNFRTLLERFANNTSMQPIVDAVNQIYTDAQNDPELRSWFGQLDTYLRRILLEEGYVMQEEANEEGRRLTKGANGFFSERYRPHREAFTDAVQNFFTAYADDPLNVRFGEDWKRLMKDLVLDSEGNLQYKPHLWQDIRGVILPEILDALGYFPLPRIEYTDHAIDLVIENLTLEVANLLPNVIEMEAKNYFKLSAYNAIPNNSKHSFWIEFSQVQTDLKDVAFYYKKKSGFPRISDSGLADVTIGGSGISGKIHLESTGRRDHVFSVKEVKVSIDSLKFKIRDSKHQFLYATLRPLATSLIKRAIPKAIEAAIRNALEQLDQQLNDIKERLDDASDRDDVNRIDVVKDVFRRKKTQADATAHKADEKTGTVKFVADRESKILEWSSKNSMVEKQGERMDAANASSHGWKSPIFDFVAESKTGTLANAVV